MLIVKNKNNYEGIMMEITVRHPLISNHRFINITKPGINVAIKITRSLGKTQVYKKCSGRVNFTFCGHAPTVEPRV